MNPVRPSTSLLAKLGMLTLYVDDLLNVGPSYFESILLMKQLMKDEEVAEWLRTLRRRVAAAEGTGKGLY